MKYMTRYGADKIRLCKLHQNHGKGGAVRKGMMRARGEILLMVDADGATRIQDFLKLEERLKMISKSNNSLGTESSHGVVVGSRYIKRWSFCTLSVF